MANMTKAQAKEMFKKAKETKAEGGGSIEQLPPGVYHAQLKICEYYESQKGGKFIRHGWLIMEGGQEGKIAWDYRRAEDEKGIGYTMKEWDKLGVDTDVVEDYDTMTELAEKIQALQFECEIRIAQNRTKPEYQNFFINNCLGAGNADAEVPADDAKDEAPASEEDETIDVGDIVKFSKDGKEVQAPIIAVDEDNGKITVKLGKEKIVLGVDQILGKVD